MKDEVSWVREAAARNANATETVLQIAALDPNELVRRAARENPHASTRTRIIGVL